MRLYIKLAMVFSKSEGKMPKLEIFGWLHETSWGCIPEDKFISVLSAVESDDFDRDDFEEILDENNETGIGIDLDLQIYVDGELVAFDQEKYNEVLEEPVFIEDDNENQSYLIEETISRGCIYECNFDGVFEQENLNFYFYEYELGGSGQSIKVLEVDYDDIDCEDRNASVEGYYVKVLKSDGSIYESNVGSATDEDQKEQNSNEHSSRIYSFDDKETFQKFRKYIEENIQENIDMGINKSVIAYSDPDSGLYQITFTGPLDDLKFLPDPDLGWVEEEIGIIRDSWHS